MAPYLPTTASATTSKDQPFRYRAHPSPLSLSCLTPPITVPKHAERWHCNKQTDGHGVTDEAGVQGDRNQWDAVEVSGGTPESGKLGAARVGIKAADDEAYFLKQAVAIRTAAPDLPLMLVGGVRSLERIETILHAGQADTFSLCRPLIREPALPKRWENGDRQRAACISCSRCYGPARRGEGLRCVDAEDG